MTGFILLLGLFAWAVLCSKAFDSTQQQEHRHLADTSPNPAQSAQILRDIVHPPGKNEKLRALLAYIKSYLPFDLRMTLNEGAKPQHPQAKQAIVSVAFDPNYIIKDALHFVGTARRAGFAGDIVIPILPNSKGEFVDKLIQYNASVFTVHTQCVIPTQGNQYCVFMQAQIPISIFRAFIYLNTLLTYADHTKIMLSDFRDVFFQSDPFQSKALQYMKLPSQIVVFTESYPNRIISRCPLTSSRVLECYGKEIMQEMGGSVVSTSLNLFCMQPACLAYLFLLISQLDSQIRQIYSNTTSTSSLAMSYTSSLPFSVDSSAGVDGRANRCVQFACDLAFHNMLLYNNVFSKYLTVKVYGQG
ncbi:hypothetical protein EON63_13540 [archaeon]|nr:MAG: hypothetical protein EON63_13540 [archaeon]